MFIKLGSNIINTYQIVSIKLPKPPIEENYTIFLSDGTKYKVNSTVGEKILKSLEHDYIE